MTPEYIFRPRRGRGAPCYAVIFEEILTGRQFWAAQPQPLIAVSLVAFGSTSVALPIQSTLLHRIKTCPRVPELTPLTNSSVLES